MSRNRLNPTLAETLIYPIYYTTQEAGGWRAWNNGYVNRIQLYRLKNYYRRVNTDASIINGIYVHSLAFDEITHPGFPCWNILNGWTHL